MAVGILRLSNLSSCSLITQLLVELKGRRASPAEIFEPPMSRARLSKIHTHRRSDRHTHIHIHTARPQRHSQRAALSDRLLLCFHEIGKRKEKRGAPRFSPCFFLPSFCLWRTHYCQVEQLGILSRAAPDWLRLAGQGLSRAFPHVGSRIRTGNHSLRLPSRAILLTAA